MDFNQLLYHHQLAVMNRQRSRPDNDPETYFDLVEYYEKRIRQFREKAGLPQYL